MKAVNPYLNFDGNTEEVFEFYQSVFGGELQIVRFKDMEDSMGATGDDLEKIAHVSLPIGGNTMLMGDDGPAVMGQPMTVGDNFSINLEAENAQEAEKVFNDLSAGGKITMPLQETEWAAKFGMLTDKYGISWSVNYPGEEN
ncbi:MAG: VOC family protein [Balneolaceae bacterium]|nr:VOC family protein [Balneolaceae bacterium]